MALLKVINICKRDLKGLQIDDINFEQQQGQKIAIAGESGAGKTTLLKIISGYMQPTTGEVLFEGKRVIGPDEKLLLGHPQIGYLSQHYELLNNYKVEALVWFENKLPIEEVNTLFDICQIKHLLNRRTNELSGGERQRIALCMLLIKAPKLLLLDEPFSNLDLIHKLALKKVVADISDKLNITCILTSHDPQDTLSWADEILVMKNGQIVQQGKPQQVYYHPVNEYVAGLFGKYNLLNAQQVTALFGNKIFIHKTQQLLIRSEQFHITSIADAIFVAKVVNISFWGNYYEVKLQVNNITLIMNMLTNDTKIGERIGVAIDIDKICLV